MYSAGTGGTSGGEVEGELLSSDTEEGRRLSIKPVLLTSTSRAETTYALEKTKHGHEAFEIHSQGCPCQFPLPFVASGEGAVGLDLRSHAALSGGEP